MKDIKHLVAGRNEKLLHEGFETLEEAQRYVREHRNHHLGAKQKAKLDKARAERQQECRRKEEAKRVMARARAAQEPNRPRSNRRPEQVSQQNHVHHEPDSDPRRVTHVRIPKGYAIYVIADSYKRGIYQDWE